MIRLPFLGPSRYICSLSGQAQIDCSEVSFFEIAAHCLGCLGRICHYSAQPFSVHATTKLRQRIFYEPEILVLRIVLSSRVKTEKRRGRICSHIRHVELLYIGRGNANASGCEIIVKLVVGTMISCPARWMKSGVRRSWPWLHGVRAGWFCGFALSQRLQEPRRGTDVLDSVCEVASDVHHGCNELFVTSNGSCKWDAVLLTKSASLLLMLMLSGGNNGIPLATRTQPSCYLWMRGVCMRPDQRMGEFWVWRCKDIGMVVPPEVGACPNAL